MKKDFKIEHELLARSRALSHQHLLLNPNYFGTVKDAELAKKFKPVLELVNYQNYYEELECIDYKPDTRQLGAVIKIKQANGYSGGPCAGGSREYVRFFVDYDNNGNWVDEGMVELGVYDHVFNDDLCYHVEITLGVNKTSCCKSQAILPNVRAILSWNIPPTPNDPDFPFVWGQVKESHIQIAPRNSFWCYILDSLIKIPDFKLPEIAYHPDFEKKYFPQLNDEFKYSKKLSALSPSPVELKKIYGKEVHESRIAFKTINTLMHNKFINNNAALVNLLPDFNYNEIFDYLQKQKFNTEYEELHCVSLNREANRLHASIQLKRSSGFSGSLCTAGSKEYVAFYMDFGSGWEYMGTNSVTVHDIPNVPADGLWYDIPLSINLDKHRKAFCQVGKARVKGILSWNIAPPVNDPDHVAAWGDWEECDVEVKPKLGIGTAVLEKVGGMIVNDIDNGTGLATTSFAGSLGNALDSPFYGTMELIGTIFDTSLGWSYRFLITSPSAAEHPLLDKQVITTDTLGTFNDVELVPDADGWISYLQAPNVNIVGGLIGRYGAYTAGKHTIKMEAKDGGGTIYAAGTVIILVDPDAPDVSVHITTGGGDCADFTTGDLIYGTFQMTDAHAGSLALSVTPDKGAVVTIISPVVAANGLSYKAGTLPGTGTTGDFVIDTKGVPKCGYNIRIDAYDRTILHSHTIGFHNNDIQGFCLRDIKEKK